MNSKIVTLDELLLQLKAIRKPGFRVVFTNGCFDILHAGHVRYLTAAKACGDVLIVGLNSDASVRTIKGKNRPIVNEQMRAEVLAGLMCTDYITIFSEPDPLNLIKAIKPDVLVKGADWAEEHIIGADEVKSYGGRVERIALVSNISTSQIIQKCLTVLNEIRCS